MCKAIEDLKKDARKEGKIEGIAEGEARGEAKKLNENIKTMYKNGADETMIAKFLGLDISFVKKVLA